MTDVVLYIPTGGLSLCIVMMIQELRLRKFNRLLALIQRRISMMEQSE